MKYHKLLAATSLASAMQTGAVLADSGTLNAKIILQRNDFEAAADFAGFQAGSGEFSLSDRHYKGGKKSLKWAIRGQAPLLLGPDLVPGVEKAAEEWPGGQPETFEPSYIPKSKQGGIKLWVYREKASPSGTLTFGWGSDEKAAQSAPKYRAVMNQNFTGWRAFWVHFEEDAKVADYQGEEVVRSMAVQPSADLDGSEVYFDLMQFVSFVSKKRHSDDQFVNNKDKTRHDSYLIHNHWKKLEHFKTDRKITKAEAEAISTIEQRLQKIMLGDGKLNASAKDAQQYQKMLEGKLAFAEKTFDSFKIQRKDGALTGLPLFSSRDEQPGDDYGTFQVMGSNTFYAMAMDYALEPSEEKLNKIFDLFDHFENQGFTAGSSIGTTDHVIRLNFYSAAAFIMRDALRKTGRLEDKQATLAWHTRFGKLAGWDESLGENTDLIRGGALPKLVSVLLMEDSGEKADRMAALVKYLSWAMEFAPGYMDTIKPDYSIYHHRNAYQNSYGLQALTSVALVHWLTQGTDYQLPTATIERVKDAFKAQYNFAADFEMHPGIAGRFPYSNSGIDRFLLPGYAFFADMDGEIVDPEMATIFANSYAKANLRTTHSYLFPGLSYYGGLGTIDLMERVYQSAKPRVASTGRLGNPEFFTLPYAGLANKKTETYSAAVRGFSKYIWDFESGHKVENPFGRYTAFGALLLFTGEDDKGLLTLGDSGMGLASGFHWGFMPGATTKAMPMEKVAYMVEAHPKYGEGKHRNFTEDTFMGSTQLGNDGVFSMRMTDTVPADGDEAVFEEGFSFNKSFFFFGDEIVALGSDIKSSDNRYPTVTTLYQNLLNVEHPAQASVDGKPAQGSSQKDGGLFGDAQGNYYVVNKGSVVTEVGKQDSLLVKKAKKGASKKKYKKSSLAPVSVQAAKSFIDHGKAPQGASYDYQILIGADLGAAKQRLSEPNYKVLQQDNKAHIVQHQGANKVGYAVFDPSIQLPGAVAKVDTPLILMASETQGALSLAVTDPNLYLHKWNHNMSYMPLDITNGKAGEHVATLELEGEWKLKSEHSDVLSVQQAAGKTLVKVRNDHGLTRNLEFVK